MPLLIDQHPLAFFEKYQLITVSLSYSILLLITINYQNSKAKVNMRKRSGALHCQSQEEFVQLAEAAQNRTGIFYDPRVNKKIMNHLNTIKQNNPSAATKLPQIHEQVQNNSKNYNGFDFGLQSCRQRQQREQVQRANLNIDHLEVISVLTLNTRRLIQKIRQHPVNIAIEGDNINFDLVIEVNQSIITKYWIIDKKYLSVQPLLNLYLQQSHIIIDESQQVKVLKNTTQQTDDEIIGRFRGGN